MPVHAAYFCHLALPIPPLLKSATIVKDVSFESRQVNNPRQ